MLRFPSFYFLLLLSFIFTSLHGNDAAMGQENPVRVVTGLRAAQRLVGLGPKQESSNGLDLREIPE